MNNAEVLMSNILNEIVAHKKKEVEQSKSIFPLSSLRASNGKGSFLQALQNPGLNIIAELKPKSPSAGTLRNDFKIEQILPVYNKYACALSVLTDSKYFDGSFELLSAVTKQSPLPTLCKDFIIDPYQCHLARSCGAEAVLLIMKILDDKQLKDLYAQIKDLGMTAVVEIQNEAELKRAYNMLPEIILINNRNLEDFSIDLSTTKKLVPLISKQTITISASGLESKQDIEKLRPFCTNFLVGSLFMRSSNLEKDFQDLIGVVT